MALFIITCRDKPGGLSARMAAREAHLAYVRGMPDTVKIGGPLLDEAGEMAGSMLIIDVADRAAAQAFCDADPYWTSGVFESVHVEPFRLTLGAFA